MKKNNFRSRALNFSAAVCFLLSFALIVILQLLKVDRIAEWYSRVTTFLMEFEKTVEEYGATWLSVVIIELNFLTKAFVPWVPISCLCVISGVLFPWHIALTINVIGMTMVFGFKYLWGVRIGGGNAEKVLQKYENVYSFVDTNRYGSPAVLFGFRLIPCLPINSISQLYGSLGFSFWEFLLISFSGFLPRLFSYTVIGRNVYDPLSAKFLVPLIVLFFFSGITLLAINGVVHVTIRSVSLLKKKFKK